jgi:hypothetical protein
MPDGDPGTQPEQERSEHGETGTDQGTSLS